MTTRSKDRNLRGGEVAGTPVIAAHRASYVRPTLLASPKNADFFPSERRRHREARVLLKRGLLPPKAADCATPSAPHTGDPIDVKFKIKS